MPDPMIVLPLTVTIPPVSARTAELGLVSAAAAPLVVTWLPVTATDPPFSARTPLAFVPDVVSVVPVPMEMLLPLPFATAA